MSIMHVNDISSFLPEKVTLRTGGSSRVLEQSLKVITLFPSFLIYKTGMKIK